MDHWFQTHDLDVERLLANWRWLLSGPRRLIARSAFGDLFLLDESGSVSRLDISIGSVIKIADSEADFLNLLKNPENRDQLFGEADETAFASKGLVPNESQCIAFDIPLVFKERGARKPYLVDIYENVSFLGDLNEQVANVPDGQEIKLIVGPRPLTTGH